MSTRCITCLPSSFPSALVCAGSTPSAISERDALTGFPATPEFSAFFCTLPFIAVLFNAIGKPLAQRYNTRRAMTEQKKSRRQMLEEFVAKQPNDAFSRYGLAMECMNAGDPAAADQHFRALLQNH